MQPTISADLICVRVEHLHGSSVGSLMSDMRTWLDHHEIELKAFRATTLPFGGVAFDVEFRRPSQATLFRAAFVN